MRVHKDPEIVLFGYPEDFYGEFNPLMVVNSRSRMLDGFPGKDVPDSVITPFAKALEMDMGIL